MPVSVCKMASKQSLRRWANKLDGWCGRRNSRCRESARAAMRERERALRSEAGPGSERPPEPHSMAAARALDSTQYRLERSPSGLKHPESS